MRDITYFDMSFIRQPHQHGMVVPCEYEPCECEKETFKQAFKRVGLNVLRRFCVFLIFIIVVVGLTVLANYLDAKWNTGGAILFFVWILSFFLGMIASIIMFD